MTQIVRRGRGNPIRVRRATIILASSSGTPVSAIGWLVAADEDTVRDAIHAFNERGSAALDPRWAGGRPRLIRDADVAFIVARPRPGPKHSAARSPAGACANSAAICAATTDAWCGSAASGCARSCATPRSAFSAPARERVARPGQGPQARPDRGSHQPIPAPVLRLRPVRATVDPALPRRHLGAPDQAHPAACDLPSHSRHPLLPRLLQPRRGPTLGGRAP